MISDVPIGVMLSGGIDSSLVAAIAQKQSLKKINTYSIAFSSKGYDESKYAKKYPVFYQHHIMNLSSTIIQLKD